MLNGIFPSLRSHFPLPVSNYISEQRKGRPAGCCCIPQLKQGQGESQNWSCHIQARATGSSCKESGAQPGTVAIAAGTFYLPVQSSPVFPASLDASAGRRKDLPQLLLTAEPNSLRRQHPAVLAAAAETAADNPLLVSRGISTDMEVGNGSGGDAPLSTKRNRCFKDFKKTTQLPGCCSHGVVCLPQLAREEATNRDAAISTALVTAPTPQFSKSWICPYYCI